VRRAHAGDPSAQRALIEHLQGSVRRTVFYLAGPYRDIDDLSQLALVEILYAAGTFRGESSLARWAEKITVRTALKHLKAQRRKDRVADEWQDELPAFQDIDLDVDARRVRMRLAVLMQDLNAACRAAMVLHYVHGYRIPEVADITGAKINTVRGRLKSGRTKLRRRILADTLLREWVKGVYK
jgi:RNA polymerase sigma-70 factor (ECF subfamily)